MPSFQYNFSFTQVKGNPITIYRTYVLSLITKCNYPGYLDLQQMRA